MEICLSCLLVFVIYGTDQRMYVYRGKIEHESRSVHKVKLTIILFELEPPFSIISMLYFVRPSLTRFVKLMYILNMLTRGIRMWLAYALEYSHG